MNNITKKQIDQAIDNQKLRAKDNTKNWCIVGGRDFTDYARVNKYMKAADPWGRKQDITFVCGMATGADTMGRSWAKNNKFPTIDMPANWRPDGPQGALNRKAGYDRNVEMALVSDVVVAFWNGNSKNKNGGGSGTLMMINICKELHKHIEHSYEFHIVVLRYV